MKAICLPRRNRSSFWAFCSLRLTFFLKWEFWLTLFNAEAIFASSFFTTREICARNWSRWLQFIHWIGHLPPLCSITFASEGKSEQAVTCLLNLIFQHKKIMWNMEFVELAFRCLLSLLPNHRTLWNIHKNTGAHGRRPSRHWNCASYSFFLSCHKSPCADKRGIFTCSIWRH